MIIFHMIIGYFLWRMIMSNTTIIPSKKISKNQLAKPKIDMGNELDREKMISEAAYFRAENRGFEDGNSVADWLVSEAEIDSVLKNH